MKGQRNKLLKRIYRDSWRLSDCTGLLNFSRQVVIQWAIPQSFTPVSEVTSLLKQGKTMQREARHFKSFETWWRASPQWLARKKARECWRPFPYSALGQFFPLVCLVWKRNEVITKLIVGLVPLTCSMLKLPHFRSSSMFFIWRKLEYKVRA